MGQRDGLVVQPLLVCLVVVDKDNEVLVLALVVDLDLSGLASRHVGGVEYVRAVGARFFFGCRQRGRSQSSGLAFLDCVNEGEDVMADAL